MAEDFKLLVGAKIDEAQLQNELNKMKTKKITISPTVKGSKEVKQLEDEMGKLYTVTTSFNKSGEKTNQTLSKMQQSFKDTSTKVKEIAKDTKVATTEVKKFTDAQGKIVTETTKFNKAGESLGTTTKSYTENIKKAEKATRSLGETFVNNFKKFVQFRISGAILSAFTGSMYEAVEAVKEFDKAQTEFIKVSDLSGDSLDDYTNKLGELGTTVARTRWHF